MIPLKKHSNKSVVTSIFFKHLDHNQITHYLRTCEDGPALVTVLIENHYDMITAIARELYRRWVRMRSKSARADSGEAITTVDDIVGMLAESLLGSLAKQLTRKMRVDPGRDNLHPGYIGQYICGWISTDVKRDMLGENAQEKGKIIQIKKPATTESPVPVEAVLPDDETAEDMEMDEDGPRADLDPWEIDGDTDSTETCPDEDRPVPVYESFRSRRSIVGETFAEEESDFDDVCSEEREENDLITLDFRRFNSVHDSDGGIDAEGDVIEAAERKTAALKLQRGCGLDNYELEVKGHLEPQFTQTDRIREGRAHLHLQRKRLEGIGRLLPATK